MTPFRSEAIGTALRREKFRMIHLMDMETKRAEYALKVDRVSRDAWMLEPSPDDRRIRKLHATSVVERIRRQVGDALVGAGEQLRGAPVSNSAALVAAPYTPDGIG
jgi:hypothetical protein